MGLIMQLKIHREGLKKTLKKNPALPCLKKHINQDINLMWPYLIQPDSIIVVFYRNLSLIMSLGCEKRKTVLMLHRTFVCVILPCSFNTNVLYIPIVILCYTSPLFGSKLCHESTLAEGHSRILPIICAVVCLNILCQWFSGSIASCNITLSWAAWPAPIKI